MLVDVRFYVVQHGHALAKDVDPDRPLSEQGRSDVGRVAVVLARADAGVGRVIHSGKTRARQTAEILAAKIGRGVPVEARPGLEPNDDPKPVSDEIAGFQHDAILVGHMPFVGRLVSRLCTGEEEPQVVAFAPGSVACLERRDGAGFSVAWMIRPELV
jgi:phosphohistidine phosphatase